MSGFKKIFTLIIITFIGFSFCGCLQYTANIIEITRRNIPVEPVVPVMISTTSTTAAIIDNSTTDPSVLTTQNTSVISQETTTLPFSVTEQIAPSTTVPQDEPSKWTTQKILSFVAAAINKTKAYTSPITVNHKEKVELNITKVPGGSIVQSLINKIIKGVIKPTDEILSFNGGKTVNPEGETIPLLLPKRNKFSLATNGVASATASKNGGNTVIRIKLVKEMGTLTQLPEYNAGSVGYLDSSVIDFEAYKITLNYLNIAYSGTTLDITVNPSGYVTSAVYKLPFELSCEGSLAMITAQVECNGTQSENWIINW